MKRIIFLFFLLVACLSLTACGNNAKVISSSDEYFGEHYEMVISELEKGGFSNIETLVIDDLKSDSMTIDGGVEYVSIDGNKSFEEKTVFTKDVKVIVKYHIIKKLPIPISSDKIQELDYIEIGKAFENEGFTNVTTSAIYDIDPDETEVDHRNEVIINDSYIFEEGDEYPFDANISIKCHYPYAKYLVKIHINFTENWIFNKYNVNVSIDEAEQYTLNHGENADYEFKLKEGEHTLTFSSESSDSVKGEVKLQVDCGIEAAFTIYCHGDEVSVTTHYIDRQVKLTKKQAKVKASATEYKYKNYEDVIAELEGSGFTNIEPKALYDIVLGITDEGEVSSVTIDGKKDFTRGTIFAKNAKVIVSYHMPEEDDPSKIHPPYDSDSSAGANYEVVSEAFKNAGFTNINTAADYVSSDWGYEEGTVSDVYIGGVSCRIKNTYFPNEKVKILYYVIEEESESESSNSKSNTSLTESYAQQAFAQYGKALFPYGFKCHWFLDLRNSEQAPDGSWFFKVGVTIENQYGNKRDAIAEGRVSGTDINPMVTDFYVNL